MGVKTIHDGIYVVGVNGLAHISVSKGPSPPFNLSPTQANWGNSQPQPLFCITFDGIGHALAGSQNGDVYIFDEEAVVGVERGAHQGAIYALHCHDGGSVCGDGDSHFGWGVVSGGKDGKVCVWG